MMNADVLIVGAGIAGLMAAKALEAQGFNVIVLDKGSSVGGRLATRRIGGGKADHGAQFFTARTDLFKQQVDEWIENGLVFTWSHGWSDGSMRPTYEDGHPRYAVKEGMNRLAKYLAKDLKQVKINTQVTLIATNEDKGWSVHLDTGDVVTGRALILTPPVPQCLELFRQAQIRLSDNDRVILDHIQYGPCLCAMFVVEGDVYLPDPGAMQDFDKPIYWIADNQRKGISPDAKVITVHAGTTYSRQRWDQNDGEILTNLEEALKPLLKEKSKVTHGELKRWLYSIPLTTHPEDYYQIEGQKNLLLAGDAFGGRGRVEGAALSGLAAAQALIKQLNDT